MPELNPWAILVAAAATFVLGGVWYSPILFEKAWREGTGLSEEHLKRGNMGKIFGFAFLITLVMAANLAAFLGGQPNLGWGIAAGALAGVGWVALSLGVIYLFERRPMKLFLVNAGYLSVSFIIMGAILGVWK
jgi:hypothetical protein